MSEHGNVLEADLQRYFGVELGDLYRGTLTLRRLRVLIDGLPFDSRTARVVVETPPELMPWSLDSALLGRLVDELSALRWEYEAVHSDERRPAPKSVLPHSDVEPETARVIPLVSPHRLGPFIDDDLGGDRGG